MDYGWFGKFWVDSSNSVGFECKRSLQIGFVEVIFQVIFRPIGDALASPMLKGQLNDLVLCNELGFCQNVYHLFIKKAKLENNDKIRLRSL